MLKCHIQLICDFRKLLVKSHTSWLDNALDHSLVAVSGTLIKNVYNIDYVSYVASIYQGSIFICANAVFLMGILCGECNEYSSLIIASVFVHAEVISSIIMMYIFVVQ